MSNKHVFSTTLAGRPLSVEIGELAKQANGAVLVRYGDTVVLSAAVASKKAGTGDFFPLTVHYIEKMYAVGKVPGGFIKREGRPSEAATLTSRLIDRPLRPMFPEGVRNEIQITNTVLSVDQDCTPEMAAMLGASLALAVSDIPFDGPVAGVNVGRVNGEIVINPTVAQAELSDIELTVAGTATAINMVESSAKEVSEADMLEALLKGHAAIKELVAFQNEIVAQIGKEKFEFTLAEVAPEVAAQVGERYKSRMIQAIQTQEKKAREAAVDAVMEEATEFFAAVYADRDDYDQLMKDVSTALHDLEKDEVRRLITKERVRPDGRRIDEIRPLSSSVALLPRVHGSGLFTRGQTQVLTAATLAPLGEHQVIDGLGIEEGKRFIHHYNFPNFSVGETGRVGSPGRREIGHGALGERALKQVIPAPEDFPYTIRLVSEVLESNGSSSQASICAGTLALMDAGVPIKAPVAGIAMGLVMEGEDYTVLTDIQGLEDHLGDMDFKVAGTSEFVTAIQLDTKLDGIPASVLAGALTQAREARLHILDVITAAIDAPDEMSEFAPRIISVKVPVAKIGEVIGPKGKMINQIQEDTGADISIEDDGTVFIGATDGPSAEAARTAINAIANPQVPEVGERYLGTVVKVTDFGAFISLTPGKDGLLHISEMRKLNGGKRVVDAEDVVSVGQKVQVEITKIDDRGKLSLSPVIDAEDAE